MTDVHMFKAANMHEALDTVRRELGPDAVILHTRQIEQRRFLPWLKPRETVEITAGMEINVPQVDSTNATTSDLVDSTVNLDMDIYGRPDETTDTADADECQYPVNESTGEIDLSVVSESPTVSQCRISPDTFQRSSESNGDTAADSNADSANANSANANSSDAGSSDAQQQSTGAGNSSWEPTSEFATKLDSIQRMIANLGHVRHSNVKEDIPNELFHVFTDLIDADVDDDLARELTFRLKENCTPQQLADQEATKAFLTAMVESDIRCSGPITAVPGRRKVVALVGPTGVGKTTTIAKLAANFRLRDGVKMGLVTVDTYRIAAVEQLRTYAEIIDLPMKVVTNPIDMRRTMDELVGLDLILIDTAGRSPRDELQIQELKRLLAEANVDEVHLVQSLTASLRSIKATAEKFATANTTSLILTKLDETAEMGTMLSVSREVPLPVSYLTTGQDVPDDIEPAHATRMARLILGQDRIFD